MTTLSCWSEGFTGEKYGGASYWDTEAYCLPFFLGTHEPQVAEQLLRYRHNQLGKAIENAEKLGFDNGAALYPMVTANGEECHNEWEITFEEITATESHGLGASKPPPLHGGRFLLAERRRGSGCGGGSFLGAARELVRSKQAYVILGVTGPNEYENNVNNNWYTNFLAQWCLKYADELVDKYGGDASAEERAQTGWTWPSGCTFRNKTGPPSVCNRRIRQGVGSRGRIAPKSGQSIRRGLGTASFVHATSSKPTFCRGSTSFQTISPKKSWKRTLISTSP